MQDIVSPLVALPVRYSRRKGSDLPLKRVYVSLTARQRVLRFRSRALQPHHLPIQGKSSHLFQGSVLGSGFIHESRTPAASIWFEIWGVVNSGKEISNFSNEISENFQIFSRQKY